MKFKVAQCWDDGVYTDIRLIGILREYGAKATFNLNPGNAPEETRGTSWGRFCEPPLHWGYRGFDAGKIAVKDWKHVYRGFKVASHCWKHEVAGRVSDEEFAEAAVKARKLLEDIFETSCPGFAWPCGISTPETVKLLKEAGFAYGRTTKAVDDVSACRETVTLDPNCHFADNKFREKYMRVKEQGGVFYFWGHSYEMMDCEGMWDQLEQKIRFISEDPDAEWCDVIDLVPLCGK